MRKWLFTILCLSAVIACGSATAQTTTLSNDQFQVAVATPSGGISSLKLKGDVQDTDYIWNGKIIGAVKVKYRLGAGTWLNANTSSSADNRIVTPEPPTRVRVDYTSNSSSSSGIKNFSLFETYEIQGKSLVWSIRIKNRSSQTLEIGDLSLPLFFNTDYEVDAPTLFTKRVIRHSFIAGDGSYIFCCRTSGIGPYLVMTPMPGSRFEYFTDSGNPYDYTAYIHASQKANTSGVGGEWQFPVTNRVIAAAGSAGDEVTYSFKFSWADDYKAVRDTLVRDGLIDVESVPGMVVPQNTTFQLSLRTNEPISVVAADHTTKTEVQFLGRRHGNINLYSVRFSQLGENRLTVNYGFGRKLYLQYFCTQPIETLIKKRASFIATKQQWKNTGKWYDGLFSLWDMSAQVLRSPDDTAGLMAYCVGGSDDPSNCKGPYVALKNITFPVQSEIDAVEYHLSKFVWGGLQRKDTELPYAYGIYGIDNWYVNRNSSYGMGSGGRGQEHLWRGYDYPALATMYYAMYKIAKLYPSMPKYLDADGYLTRAYNTALAFFQVPNSIFCWWGLYSDGSYKLGMYNEVCIPSIIDDLYAEGRVSEANALKAEWEKKVKFFIYDDPYPYTSEYSMDSTAYECSETIAKYALDRGLQPDTNLWQDKNTGVWYSHPNITRESFVDFQERQMAANIADRGWLEPNYYQMGNDIRGCNNAFYVMTYMSQMGGWGILDYALHYSDDPVTHMRLGYASYMSCWALINAGDSSSGYGYWYPGIGNDGAAAWAYEPQQTGKMWCNNQTIGRWAWKYDGEIDHGFMGGLRSAATIVVSDPIFGLYAYGGTVSRNESSMMTTITPQDGLRQRFHMMNLAKPLHLEINRDRFTKIFVTTAPDDSVSALSLSIEKATLDAHTATVTVEGLPVGDYRISIPSIASRTVHINEGVNTINLSLPAGSAIIADITLLTTMTGTVRSASGTPIPNAVVQIGGFGGPAAISDSSGIYHLRIPDTGRHVVYADALGYAGNYSVITVAGGGGLNQDITLNPAEETGVIVNGSFEGQGTSGPGTAAGWQWIHPSDPTGPDFLGNPWPAMNPDMYSGVRDTSQNQTPGGSACGVLRVGTAHPYPGIVSEAAFAASGTLSGVTTSTAIVTGSPWTANQWAGYDLVLQKGTIKRHYPILSNTANIITVQSGNLVTDGFGGGSSYRICKLNCQYWYPGWVSQIIEVDPSSLYNFYFKGSLDAQTGAFWVFRWLDANHAEISGWMDSRADWTWPTSPEWRQYLTGMYWNNGWQRNVPMLQMTPPAGAKYIEVAFGFTEETFQSRTGTLLIDDVVVDRLATMAVSDAKSAPDGISVMLNSKSVTLAPRDASGNRSTTYFYVEEADRSAGIRITDGQTGQDNIKEGDSVTLSGTVKTDTVTRERYIELTSAPITRTGTSIEPVLMNTKSVHTDKLTIGELVRVAGKVLDMPTDGRSFTISDGHNPATRVIVEGSPISGEIHKNDTATITGVVSKTATTAVIILRKIEKVE